MRQIQQIFSKPLLNIFRFILLFSLFSFLYLYLPAGNGSKSHTISFKTGNSLYHLAEELKKNSLIRSSFHFVIVAKLHGFSKKLKAGDYNINDAMSTMEIIDKIVNGRVDFRKFTLPEGYSIYQGAELAKEKKFFTVEEFLAAAKDREIIKKIGLDVETLEGFLYPATYNLTADENVKELVIEMVGNFLKKNRDIMERHSDFYNYLIIASIIEKEAVTASEKPLISSVFHNRLKIGMPLQSDPTAIYGVKNVSAVSKDDLMIESRYNTYKIKGLPPTPIANPSRDSIIAAINPAKTDYLYFVAKKDGTHHFSKTLSEHNSAVYRYLKR